MMLPRRIASLVTLLLVVGCAAPKHLLGAGPVSGPATALTTAQHSREAGDTNPVILHGTMVEKCPTAACWFRLQDPTGVVKVDVKGAYFTVTDVPVGAEVTVRGKLNREGDEWVLSASGLTY